MDNVTGKVKYFITNEQARMFLLRKHGLIGEHLFIGQQGVLNFIKQVGCIQYDPIDVCGKNAQLVLQSRVKGFSKQLLDNLLYKERLLIDYFDKNLSIMSIDDWKYFSHTREAYQKIGKSKTQIALVEKEIKQVIKEKGYVSSKDLKINDSVEWYWSSTTLARAALETLYFRGELAIHHKKGTIKYYSLSEDLLSSEVINKLNPNQNEYEFKRWMVLRRIGAVGLLWNKPSDAWLGIGLWSGVSKMKAEERTGIFEELTNKGEIIPIQVEGINPILYCLGEDLNLLKEIMLNKKYLPRTELLAPLDNLLWDRKLLKAIFNFDYTWEIYTPLHKRKYGYYVLPILYGLDVIGRAEITADKKNKKLLVKRVWLEENKTLDKKSWLECLDRFAKFNDCSEIIFDNTDN